MAPKHKYDSEEMRIEQRNIRRRMAYQEYVVVTIRVA